MAEAMTSSRGPAERAQTLLEWLVDLAEKGQPHVCTYAWAYAHVIRQPAKPWSQAYANRIWRLALETRPVALPGLGEVQLDTFIVSKQTREPAAGYWERGRCDPDRWRRVLRGATVWSDEGQELE
jgi:hypothetical protein